MSCVTALARQYLVEVTPTSRTFRRIAVVHTRILVACSDSCPAHPLGETALHEERIGRLVNLALQECGGPADGKQDRIRGNERVLALQPFGTTPPHRQDVFPELMIKVVRYVESV